MSTGYVDSQPSTSIKLQMMWSLVKARRGRIQPYLEHHSTQRSAAALVARIPYPVTVPKYYAVASEVATIEYRALLGCLGGSGGQRESGREGSQHG